MGLEGYADIVLCEQGYEFFAIHQGDWHSVRAEGLSPCTGAEITGCDDQTLLVSA